MKSRMARFMICGVLLASASSAGADTSFNRSTIVGVDHAQRTLTFKTPEGQQWTLPVADSELLKKKPVKTGDQVSLEVDFNDRVTDIIKVSELPAFDQRSRAASEDQP